MVGTAGGSDRRRIARMEKVWTDSCNYGELEIGWWLTNNGGGSGESGQSVSTGASRDARIGLPDRTVGGGSEEAFI